MVTNNAANNATAATGKVLQGAGVGTASAFSTATYPATATTTGQILRADGTNWSGTTATYPNAAGTIGNVLTSDGTNWISSSSVGPGDVVGPASATDNALVRFDGATGKLIQNGVITEDDTGNLIQSAAVSGASLSLLTANTSNTASATAFHNVQVAGSTASDAYYKAEISGGQAWTLGLDNSDSDAFVVSASATPGTTNVIRSSTAGAVNMPLQPGFFGYSAADILNVTGDGTLYTVVWDSTTKNVGTMLNTTTGVATIPVAGNWLFTYSLILSGITVAHTGLIAALQKNAEGSTRRAGFAVNPGVCMTGGVLVFSGSIQLPMAASDTISLFIVISGSTKVVDVSGAESNSSFSGILLS